MTSPQPAGTEKVAVSTTYHGVTVTEEYRWLEDATSEATRSWTAAQNAFTRAFLDKVSCFEAVRRRVEQIVTAESVSWGRFEGPRQGGQRYFVLKQEPPKQQPFLVALTDLADLSTATVIVDPNTVDETGATTIDWFVPSPDGRLVAVSLSSHGTEQGTLQLIDAESGTQVDIEIPRVNSGTAGGSLAWAEDSSHFWYTRAPAPGERPAAEIEFFQEVWHHVVGEPLEMDRCDQPTSLADERIVEHNLCTSPDGRFVSDRAEKGDGGECQVFLRPQGAGSWWRVADISDECVGAAFGSDALYLLSRAGAPRGQVLRLALADGATVADAPCVVGATDVTIESIAATSTRLWLLDIDGGPSGLRVCDADGGNLVRIEVPPISAIDNLSALDMDEVVYSVESFTSPRVWWTASGDAAPQRTALAGTTPFDFSEYEVRREFAVSEDGTRVPLTVIAARTTPRDGSAPALLSGYGGYGISLKPEFEPAWLPWLEQGAVLAIANLRGGGEYGWQWHVAGRLANKQNAFDDFAACARHLVDCNITSANRLALIGGSNGGLLMGATLTQHPTLASVVVALVPIMDMLRVELHPNGAFNVTEFGTVEDPEQFEALLAYSPYHHVEDGTAYPATLLVGGEFDPRVDAYHAKKMAARLQAATSSTEPILLRIDSGGHGLSKSLDEVVAELADVYAFIFDRLGIAYRQPAAQRRAGTVHPSPGF